ncbi:MAG: shikimate kinase [Sporolactobacillus sp.]
MVQAILTGFMGSGKTTIGRALADALNCAHLDLDELIVRREATPIRQLFAERGEPFFRAIETEMLTASLGRPGILSTGGGTLATPANEQLLKGHAAPVIYLKTSFAVISVRLKADRSRPLFRAGNANTRQLFQTRSLVYERSADVIVSTDGKAPAALVEEIRQKVSF